jgi:lysophospholipase L1-like esterase
MHDSRKPKRWLRLILAATAVAVTAVAVGNAHHPVPASAGVGDAAPVVPEPRSVGWVGDSIGWQSRPEIESAVSRTHRLSTFNSILGATVEYQTAATHDVVLGPDSPDILLVELGTNDTGKVEPAQFADDIRRFLDGVTPHVECVRWLDLKQGGSSVYQTFNENAVRYNTILAEVVEEYPTVRLMHYSWWAQLNGPAAFDVDGVHLSRRGERGLGQLASRAAELCETDIDLRSEPAATPADRA